MQSRKHSGKPGPLRPPCNDKEPLSGRDFRRPDLPPRSCGIDRKRAQKCSEKQIPSQNHHTRRKDKSRQKRQEHPQQFKHGSIIIEVVHNTEFSVRFNKSFRPGRKHIEHARKHEGNDQRNAHHRNKQRPQKYPHKRFIAPDGNDPYEDPANAYAATACAASRNLRRHTPRGKSVAADPETGTRTSKGRYPHNLPNRNKKFIRYKTSHYSHRYHHLSLTS